MFYLANFDRQANAKQRWVFIDLENGKSCKTQKYSSH